MQQLQFSLNKIYAKKLSAFITANKNSSEKVRGHPKLVEA
jgi:hypothetical protein